VRGDSGAWRRLERQPGERVSDLVKRWAVAAVGIPSVLGLLYLGGWPLAVPLAALAALGSLEYYRMAASRSAVALRWIGAGGAAGFVLAASWRPAFSDFAPVALGLLVVLTAATLIGMISVRSPEDRPLASAAVTLFGSVYVGLPLAFVPLLHSLSDAHGWSAAGTAWVGALVVALPLASTWLGDAVALFAGTAWGSGGLAPSISPNKSWVGVWGGLAGAGVAGAVWFLVAGSRLPGLPVSGPLGGALVGVLLGMAAIVGDLAESLLKRDAGVKDSGSFFPGHGGVLDRLDALIFTLPAAYVMLVVLEAVS
jgi:phosphatidate cytidylyltransferase